MHLKAVSGAAESVWRVKAFVAKPDDLSSITGTHMAAASRPLTTTGVHGHMHASK